MSRKDFPLEHEGPLDFAQLIRALDTVVGERVCLPKAASGSGLEVGGALRRFEVELEQPQISGSEASVEVRADLRRLQRSLQRKLQDLG